MTIYAKVAALISEREVAFNQGAISGIALEDVARILQRTAVLDPETRAELGIVVRTLASFSIIEVEEHFSVGRISDRVGTTDLDVLTVAGLRGRTLKRLTDDRARAAADPRLFYLQIGQEVEVEPPVTVEGS